MTKSTKPKPFTEREKQVMILVTHEMDAKEIGHELKITPTTAQLHRRSLMRKINRFSEVGIAIYALTHGYVHLNDLISRNKQNEGH